MAIIAINGFIFRGHELDDALIYVRYIQNLISGNGFVYNSGEYVNGLTSPLFAYLSIAPAWILSDARYGAMLVSVLGALGTALVFYKLLTQFHIGKNLAAVSALIAAGSTMTYINLGMETSLFTLLIGICLYLYFTDRHMLLGVFTGLAILTRPEAVFLVPAMALNTWLFRRTWPNYRCYIAPAIMVGAQLAFNLAYYGAILPSSGVAKISQGLSGDWGGNIFLFNLGYAFILGFGMPGQLATFGLYLIPILMFLLAAFSVCEESTRQYLVVTSIFLAIYTAFFAALNIPSQWWYYAIWFTAFLSYLVIGAHWLVRRFRLARFKALPYLSVIGLSAFLVWQQVANLNLHGRTIREDYRQIGLWIDENTDADATIAMAEIGTVGWYSNRQVIDILGLVSSGNSDFVAEGDYTSWLELYRPDYILSQDPPRVFEEAVRHLQQNRPAELMEVASFSFPGQKLYRYLPSD